MSNKLLTSTFEEFGINLSQVTDIQWRTQDSNCDSLLFYKFNQDSILEVKKCKERLKDSEYKFCIINTKYADEFEGGVVCVSNKVYKGLQESALNFFYPLNFRTKYCCVTGTNGKTTTVDIIRQLLLIKSQRVMTVGTLGVYINNDLVEDFSLTTPSYIDLRKVIHKYQDKIDVLAMEVSSHALVQNRIGSLKFCSAGWTNFTQDHLDFHGTMGEYFKAKRLLFDHLGKNSFISLVSTQPTLIKKLENQAIKIIDLPVVPHNPFFKMEYNRENLAIAVGVIKGVAPEFKFSELDFQKIKAPPGRFNIIENNQQKIIIDYAHTPDGLLSITKEIKSSFPNQELITIFGCGGNRDKLKRPLMAQAAQKYSDCVILSSDNPRFEDPLSIIEDAKAGFDKANYKVFPKRAEAIRNAIMKYPRGVVLIAGKGNENYIDINGVKEPYSDLEVVLEVMGK